jgi:chromosome partitioning protein
VTTTATGTRRSGLGWPGTLSAGAHLGWPDVTRRADVSRATVSRETSPNSLQVRTAAEIAAEADEREGGLADTPIAAETAEALRATRTSRANPLPRPASTRLLTVANQKGGVGKTTTTVNLAAALAQLGARVLVLDLDPQGNASTALGIDHHADVPSIYDVLLEGRPLAEVISPVDGVPGLFCVPATIDLAGAEIELVPLVARESRLLRAVTALLDSQDDPETAYDYVLVDCPPSLGLLTVNALVAASEVLIPIQCEYYALEGLGQLMRNVDLIRSHLNPQLHVSTILLTMYDARTRLASQVADEVRTHFGHLVLSTTVPRSVRISEAPSYGETVMTYDPSSSGALSYLEAARELAGRHAQIRQHEETAAAGDTDAEKIEAEEATR